MFCMSFGCRLASAATYHVAQSAGSDANDGSAAHPFATIGACAKIVQAGDTCLVHAGTYRETVSPANSGTAERPIILSVAAGECATVSGAEPVSATFTETEPQIWVAPVADTVEQLFSNGDIVWEAQWPNRTPGVLFDLPKGVAGPGTGVQTVGGTSVSTLVDPNIPPGDWTGATVYILPGQRWQSDSRPIRAYDPATHTLTLDTTIPWGEAAIQPIPTNPYYLYGSRLALDAQDEWLWSNGSLYYYSTDDPHGHALEYKKRAYAFDVSRSYVQITGFRVFGAAVRISGSHDTIDSLTVEYPSHLRSFNSYYTEGDVNRISGDDNVWKNSLIEKSGSAGIRVAGNRNLIENNVIDDVAYQAPNRAGIDMGDWTSRHQGNVVVFNTVNRSGRGGIFAYGARDNRILFNEVRDWALLTYDMGGIYTYGTDGEGTEIAFNELGGSNAFWSNGIYLDEGSKHFVVHHNYVHDSKFFGFCVKEEDYFFDNTVQNVGAPFITGKARTGAWTNTNLAKIQNNLMDGTLLVRVGVLPTRVTDYGYFEAEVHATADWQHVVIPFASLYRPGWFTPAPLDLTSVQQIAFMPWTDGDFELDVDNVELLGTTPLLLDDFESGGGQNALGGYPWAGTSVAGVQSGGLVYQAGGATAASAKYAHFAGTMAFDDNSWTTLLEGIPNRDLSGYDAIAFDVRGRLTAFRISMSGNSPVQSNNGICSFSGKNVPACAVDRGVAIAGITDGYGGKAPDLGAFEATAPAWSAGADRAEAFAGCGKVPDVTRDLPPPYPSPWSDGGVPDGGASDASAPDGGASDGAVDASTGHQRRGAGCGCRIGEGDGGPSSTSLWAASLIVVLTAASRRRLERSV